MNAVLALPRNAELSERLQPLAGAERAAAALLGVLVGNDRMMSHAVQRGANAGWFTVPLHRKVWNAMAAVANRGGRFDLWTLQAALRDLEPADRTLMADIADLCSAGRLDAFLGAYCEVLRVEEGRREAAAVFAEAVTSGDAEGLSEELAHKSGLLANLADAVLYDGSGSAADRIDEADAEVERTHEHGVGLNTGLFLLDGLFRGWRKGEMIVCGARPGVGKSSFAVTVAEHTLARDEESIILYASAEMRDVEVHKRLISCRSRVATTAMESRQVSGEQRSDWADARESFRRRPCFVSHKGMQHAAQVKASATALKMKHGRLDLVIVDHIHAMQDRALGRTEKITNLSNAMAVMARELEVPVLVLAQLNRAIETRDDKTPQLSDLRDSGALEQDADIVVFLHRDRIDGSEQRRSPITHVNIAKHRRFKPATARIHFHEEYTRFGEIEPERDSAAILGNR